MTKTVFPMKKLMAAAGLVLLLTLLLVGLAYRQSASAASPSASYGPFAGASPDSGTCANWANDTYNRVFTIEDTSNANPDATHPVTVREDFTNGHFVTIAGASPGACQTVTPAPGNGNTVAAGIVGSFSGYELFTVTGGTLSTSATPCARARCQGVGATHNSDAVTAVMTARYGGAETTATTVIYNLIYDAGYNGQWRNASADQGGNLGDIAGTQPQIPAALGVGKGACYFDGSYAVNHNSCDGVAPPPIHVCNFTVVKSTLGVIHEVRAIVPVGTYGHLYVFQTDAGGCGSLWAAYHNEFGTHIVNDITIADEAELTIEHGIDGLTVMKIGVGWESTYMLGYDTGVTYHVTVTVDGTLTQVDVVA